MIFPKRLSFLSLSLLTLLIACTPKVSLTVSPSVISKGDSVFLNWKVKGNPTMMVDTRKIARPPYDSTEVMEFTLSAKKGKKEKYVKRQVILLPGGSYDQLAFTVSGIRGDTLIAGGTKDLTAWKNYQVITLASASKRPLYVTHEGRSGLIGYTASGILWQGLPYAGYWKIETLLTPEEKLNHSEIPGLLLIKAFIRRSNYNDGQQ